MFFLAASSTRTLSLLRSHMRLLVHLFKHTFYCSLVRCEFFLENNQHKSIINEQSHNRAKPPIKKEENQTLTWKAGIVWSYRDTNTNTHRRQRRGGAMFPSLPTLTFPSHLFSLGIYFRGGSAPHLGPPRHCSCASHFSACWYMQKDSTPQPISSYGCVIFPSNDDTAVNPPWLHFCTCLWGCQC